MKDMKSNLKQITKVKGEERAQRLQKEKSAPEGGGFGAAIARARVNRNYQGVPKEELPKINVQVRKEKRKK